MPKHSDDGQSPLVMEVSGDFACFTRPELKTERVSYPVMTPSAARGVLEAVFWKPEFSYRIVRIEVLKPIRWFSIRRNEVTEAPSLSTVLKEGSRYHFHTSDKRDQRNTVALRDVAYRIHATMRLKEHATDPVAKYRDQFRRRLARGACFTHPYLGTREFSCTDFGPPDPATPPITRSEELGVMLLDIDQSGPTPRSLWFTAWLRDGIVEVPQEGIHDPARDASIISAGRPGA
ncbi:type I-C CRISPR-associated protein Cas5c [Streptosporangium sp. NPDC001681]|jgi:CRISPR-associated protein Cas5d|uniref:type I-C CRISPR-associated protein Cas5c n=1 Tax=Streptosporangium sp. NPDC001681 TaxID=3154395 RepID=UPI0033170A26